jgi:hypothetical protein
MAQPCQLTPAKPNFVKPPVSGPSLFLPTKCRQRNGMTLCFPDISNSEADAIQSYLNQYDMQQSTLAELSFVVKTAKTTRCKTECAPQQAALDEV